MKLEKGFRFIWDVEINTEEREIEGVNFPKKKKGFLKLKHSKKMLTLG